MGSEAVSGVVASDATDRSNGADVIARGVSPTGTAATVHAGAPQLFGHTVPRSALFAGAGGFGIATLAGVGVLAYGKVSRGLPTWALFAGVLTGAVATGLTLFQALGNDDAPAAAGELPPTPFSSAAYGDRPFGYDPDSMRPKQCPPEAGPPSTTRVELAAALAADDVHLKPAAADTVVAREP